jgi:hypothetical protein
MVLRLLGQSSTGPSVVLDQSIERTSLPISPPPGGQSVPADASATDLKLAFRNYLKPS